MSYTTYLNNFKISNKENRLKTPSSSKKIKSSINTPKSSKKKVKENNFFNGTISLKTKSPTSTPFVLEKAQTHTIKKVTADVQKPQRADYKFLYQIGSGGFGRVWKV